MRKYSEKKIAEDKTGEGYIFQMFYNELLKHKGHVGTAEVDKVLTALGYDLADLQNNPALKAGFNMAVCAVNDEVYEDNRPQPVDRYHFTGKDGKAIKGFTLEWYITQAIKNALSEIQFKIDFNEAVTSYLLCDWGTLNREADADNDRALQDQDSARIVARYHTCKGDIYIKTEGTSKTVIMFTCELVNMFKAKLENNKTLKHSGKTGGYSVYMHVTPEEKLYIGMTQDTEQRYGGNGNHYRKQPAFYEAIQKYGWHNIDHYVITGGLTEEEAEALEREAIQKLKAITEGYNRQEGGKGGKSVTCLNDGNIFNSLKEATEFYNISDGFICKVCKGIEKTAKGLQFEYLQRA